MYTFNKKEYVTMEELATSCSIPQCSINIAKCFYEKLSYVMVGHSAIALMIAKYSECVTMVEIAKVISIKNRAIEHCRTSQRWV